ncbi:MAG: UDP-N-acetylglucosamine 2-epimerase (hydrolyzing) [Phycisphaerales bacterium]|nr:UDP-N-acetylglucosamine 2-epimerase (hydrolyzing) [Phycisphaerales bacterium]
MDAPGTSNRRHVCVVTGSRAEFGLLRPVMHAVARHPVLSLSVVAAGSHLVLPSPTFREVKAEFGAYLAEGVPMQAAGRTTRRDDAEALGAGVSRFARAFDRLNPDWVVVLGDRIEAFAAAAAASVGGWMLSHIHGGDRAEGIADEAMRHAISKLAHLHFAATRASGERLVRMGEQPQRVHVVGSPAIDDLATIPAMDPDEFEGLGAPTVVVLMHPVGREDDAEEAEMTGVLAGLDAERVLALPPNLDPGRGGIVRAIEACIPAHPEAQHRAGAFIGAHMARPSFVGMLKTLAARGGVMVGNSSAGLIEAAALNLPVVNVGARQHGRERAGNVVDVDTPDPGAVRAGVRASRAIDRSAITHPYGEGRAGERIAELLARAEPTGLRRKVCSY